MILELTLQQQLPDGVTEEQVFEWLQFHQGGHQIEVGTNPLIDDNVDLELDIDNIVDSQVLDYD